MANKDGKTAVDVAVLELGGEGEAAPGGDAVTNGYSGGALAALEAKMQTLDVVAMQVS